MAGQKKTSAKKTSARNNRGLSARAVRSQRNINVSTASSLPISSQNTAKNYLKNPRLWVGVGVVILAVLVYLYKGLFIAAMVNGQPISRLSVIHMLESRNGKQAVGNLIIQTLILQEAKKKNITVDQKEIDAEIKKIEDTLKGQGVSLEDALGARGLTRADYYDQVKLQKLLDKMVGPSVKVTDDDVAAYIEKNRDTLPQDIAEEDLQKQVKEQLQQEAVQNKTQAFVEDLQKKAKVTYFVGY